MKNCFNAETNLLVSVYILDFPCSSSPENFKRLFVLRIYIPSLYQKALLQIFDNALIKHLLHWLAAGGCETDFMAQFSDGNCLTHVSKVTHHDVLVTCQPSSPPNNNWAYFPCILFLQLFIYNN